MPCRNCGKHKNSQDLEATGFDSTTGRGKCPCGQSYMGAPIDTCPRHWNMGLKTPEAVIEHLKKSEVVKEEVVRSEVKTESEELLDDVAEVVAEKTKKKAKKKTAKKKVAKKKSK